ncbi:dihydrofolate reductase family protein [Paenibacillus sp. CC-CFT747]|nr:dihydrofolate reductase family protein [Paenibacillus sp. CC-CFT747]
MRELILQMMVTVDGLYEGEGGDIGWHHVDEEFNVYAADFLRSVDGLVFGRITYEGMAAYWPTAYARERDPVVAEKMNKLPKYVATRTLTEAEWENTTLLRGNAAEEIARLKESPGKLSPYSGARALPSLWWSRG